MKGENLDVNEDLAGPKKTENIRGNTNTKLEDKKSATKLGNYGLDDEIDVEEIEMGIEEMSDDWGLGSEKKDTPVDKKEETREEKKVEEKQEEKKEEKRDEKEEKKDEKEDKKDEKKGDKKDKKDEKKKEKEREKEKQKGKKKKHKWW